MSLAPAELSATLASDLATGHAALLADGEEVLVATGERARHWAARGDDPAYAGDLLAALRAEPGAMALGAMSFAPEDPTLFVVPERSARLPRGDLAGMLEPGPATRVAAVTESPSREEYADAVQAALDLIATEPALEKVVLGRWLRVSADPAPSAATLLGRLAARHGHAHLFAIPSPTPTPAPGAARLVGASPELLVARRGPEVTSFPLAGSLPRSADPLTDHENAQRLLASGKDAREHALVVSAIATQLAPHCRRLDVPETPRLVATDTMWHLGTPISGRLDPGAGASLSALHLAQLLHPTPALCGAPRQRAHEVIAALEEHRRGPMGGAVGWVDGRGDGVFAVTIRAALVGDGPLRLFAGAGIVPGSVPRLEAEETAAKLGTMLRAVTGE